METTEATRSIYEAFRDLGRGAATPEQARERIARVKSQMDPKAYEAAALQAKIALARS